MPLLTFTDAAVEPLWSDLNLNIRPGELLAILDPNGVSKSALLTITPSMRWPTHGSMKVDGNLDCIPQQRMFEPSLFIRVHDLVELTADKNRSAAKEILEFVGASGVADRRTDTLSDGQQQLVRQVQTLVLAPDFLFYGKPLLSLDPVAQRTAVGRLDRHRRKNGTAVIFVIHDINPILNIYDRVFYLTLRRRAVGSVEETIISETPLRLYRTEIMVIRVEGKLIIA